MPTPPLFSVVIPAYNQKERLSATLDSIAAADFDLQRVEVIVVDDGSTDGTYEMLSGRSYPYDLRIERATNGSQSKTTNQAIRLARGTYVLSSAQDILFDPAMFQKHLAWHERAGGGETVVLGSLPYPPQLDVTPFMFYLVHGGFQFAYFLIRDRRRVGPNFLYAPNFSVRREVLERVGLFDEEFPYGCQDTDLGFRFADAGVRIVYEPDAIGYHNHPVELDGYCKRQHAVGRSILHLERKHPDYEGGPGFRDLVILQYLMCSDVRLDHARACIDRLEPLLERDEHAGYPSLWNRTFCNGDGAGTTLDPDESETYRIVKQLFEAYHTVLTFHLARGYFDEVLEVEGREQVERWVRRRTNKGQASVQLRRTLRHRLAGHGIPWDECEHRDYRVSRIVTGLEDYAAAIAYLETYQNPPAARCNNQLVLALDESAFSDDERGRLSEVAEVVTDPDPDRGVLKALSSCLADVVTISPASVEPFDPDNDHLIDRLFERIPDLSVLSGGLDDEPAMLDTMAPVDDPSPQFCCLRGAFVAELLAGGCEVEQGRAWNHELGARARDLGQRVWAVPDLRVRALGTPDVRREGVPA